MKKLSDLVANPSGFDSLANYMGELPEACWYVVLTTNRDADLLTRVNFECAQKALEGFDPDSWEVFRFGHWACGWWEALCVKEGTDAFEEGESLSDSLESYPVLDDEAFSEAEESEAHEVWESYRVKDRIEYIRRYRNQFEFRSFADLLACVRGKYFCGWASELIY